MRNIKPFTATLLLTVFLTACSPSTDELTEQVKHSMEEKFKSSGISIGNLILTKKGGAEYTGILQTKEPNGSFTYNVEVVYDGKSFTWKVINN